MDMSSYHQTIPLFLRPYSLSRAVCTEPVNMHMESLRHHITQLYDISTLPCITEVFSPRNNGSRGECIRIMASDATKAYRGTVGPLWALYYDSLNSEAILNYNTIEYVHVYKLSFSFYHTNVIATSKKYLLTIEKIWALFIVLKETLFNCLLEEITQ